jgi:thymidine kinase
LKDRPLPATVNMSLKGLLPPHRGSIEVIFGPMFSGKTTELLRRIRRFSLAQRTCLVVKYSKDTRYSQDGVSTHDRSVQVVVCSSRAFHSL